MYQSQNRICIPNSAYLFIKMHMDNSESYAVDTTSVENIILGTFTTINIYVPAEK